MASKRGAHLKGRAKDNKHNFRYSGDCNSADDFEALPAEQQLAELKEKLEDVQRLAHQQLNTIVALKADKTTLQGTCTNLEHENASFRAQIDALNAEKGALLLDIERLKSESTPNLEAATRQLILNRFFQGTTQNGKHLRASLRLDLLFRSLHDDCIISFQKLRMTVERVFEVLLSGSMGTLSFPTVPTIESHYYALVEVMKRKIINNSLRPGQPVTLYLDSSVREGMHLMIYLIYYWCHEQDRSRHLVVHVDQVPTTSTDSHLQGVDHIVELGLNVGAVASDNTESMSGRTAGLAARLKEVHDIYVVRIPGSIHADQLPWHAFVSAIVGKRPDLHDQLKMHWENLIVLAELGWGGTKGQNFKHKQALYALIAGYPHAKACVKRLKVRWGNDLRASKIIMAQREALIKVLEFLVANTKKCASTPHYHLLLRQLKDMRVLVHTQTLIDFGSVIQEPGMRLIAAPAAHSTGVLKLVQSVLACMKWQSAITA